MPMEKTNSFHIIFPKLMMEKYDAKSLLRCKIMINFFLLNVFCFCTPILSCMFSSLIYSFIIIQHCSSLMLTKKGCRNFFQCPALFLGSQTKGSFFFHTPKVAQNAVSPSFSNKGLNGQHPLCRMPESSLAWGPYVDNGPDTQIGIATSFSL